MAEKKKLNNIPKPLTPLKRGLASINDLLSMLCDVAVKKYPAINDEDLKAVLNQANASILKKLEQKENLAAITLDSLLEEVEPILRKYGLGRVVKQ